METIKIERATIHDIAELQSIGRQTFYETFVEVNTEADMNAYLDDSFSDAQLLSELNNKDSQFYFAVDGGKVIAYLKLNTGLAQKENPTENGLEIERIYVLQPYHGKGVAQQLYAKALEIASNFAVDFVWLGVWEENAKAIRFYQKNGFVAFGQHEFVIGEDVQTDILMKNLLVTNQLERVG
ncbi:MAG: GNAT family N-acetyltransferase [Flavobacterium sp.]|nr:MAG: GNAT family N-acetyltransferase [Flavobacterium sp.]